ncbi:DUF6011 domain-containing protein [Streptomyces sp. NPDC059718]
MSGPTPRRARHCGKCGRTLKSEASRQRGYGPECWRAMGGGRHCVEQGALPLEQGDGDACLGGRHSGYRWRRWPASTSPSRPRCGPTATDR